MHGDIHPPPLTCMINNVYMPVDYVDMHHDYIDSQLTIYSMVASFCHHLSDNYVDMSDLYVVLSDL